MEQKKQKDITVHDQILKHVDNNEMIKRGTDNISKIIVLPILINKAKRGFVMNGSSK